MNSLRKYHWLVLCLTSVTACEGRVQFPDAGDAGAGFDSGVIGGPDSGLDAGSPALCENDVCESGESVATCPWDCQPALPRVLPHFAVVLSDGGFRLYKEDAGGPGSSWTFADAYVDATVTDEGQGFFRLDLHPKVPVRQVSFPFMDEHLAVNGSTSDDKVFTTRLGGTVEPEGRRVDYGWAGTSYPGGFAPLVITADAQRALLVAAANWPPRPVTALHANQQNRMAYDEPLSNDAGRSYRALVTLVEGSQAAGYQPWQLALERYAKWLGGNFTPQAPPEWMQRNDGFLNVQLENVVTFDAGRLDTLWDQWKTRWNHMLFWGQMSPYQGTCCGFSSTMHARYVPGLPNFVARVVADGGYAGYYTREPETGTLTEGPGRSVYLAWLNENFINYNANTTYLDVVCRGSAAAPSPMALAQAFVEGGTVPANTVCEGFQDFIPASAGLLSGFIHGDSLYAGPDGGTFPRLGRFLMQRRLGYLGSSNGDYRYWGAANQNYAERQMFLLGLKADVLVDFGDANLAVAAHIADLRANVNWWSKAPRYMDTAALTDVPNGVDARRHVALDGTTLLTLDNESGASGLTLKHRGCLINIPSAKLSIVESPCR